LTSADGATITLADWAARIKAHFEAHFWIDPAARGAAVEPHPDLVNLRAIYKDSVGSSRRYTDYQLRPNFLIALAVAPELVEPAHAWTALGVARERLLGPLGLATLDPEDWAYR
jgi:glycogen debranching enzyme